MKFTLTTDGKGKKSTGFVLYRIHLQTDALEMRKKKGTIIWPAYIDSTLSRSQGRRIPANLAAPDVTIDIMVEAAKATNLEFDVEQTKLYPRTWYKGNQGYIVVSETSHSKRRLLLMLAKNVRKIVAHRTSAAQEAQKKSKKKHRR